MKKILATLSLILVVSISYSQKRREISREWTSFSQSVEVATETPRKFVLKGAVKSLSTDSTAQAALWARVDTEGQETGFFDNMRDRPIKNPEWKEYTIEGSITKDAKKIVVGGLVQNDGAFYFDNISLEIENNQGILTAVSLGNASFESLINNGIIKDWNSGISKGSITVVKEFTTSSTNDAYDGSYALLIKGEGTEPGYTPTRIGEIEGYTPQVGALITMLDDLKARVHSKVKNLSQYEIDHLHDEKSNRIGTLVMHLAALEVLYQNMSFENRGFNEKEKEKWGTAQKLDKKARELYKDKPISYYLDEYENVRNRTKELFKTVDDEWLKQDIKGIEMTNYFGWFHVMEHQSSHLGQILFLAKRIPPEPKINAPSQLKN